VILHSGTDMPARGERCAEDEWTQDEMIEVCICETF